MNISATSLTYILAKSVELDQIGVDYKIIVHDNCFELKTEDGEKTDS